MNTKTSTVVALSMLFLALVGCEHENLSPIGLVKWVEDPIHGLQVEKQVKDFRMQVQYKPLEYIVAMEERKPSLQETVVEARKLELGDQLDYFNFRISAAAGKDVWSYITKTDAPQLKSGLTYYLSYEMKKDFYLLDGQDTLDCKLYQFVNTSGISPNLDMVLAFEKRPEKDRLLVYDDKILNTGPVQFQIEKERINHIPTLKTQ